MVDKMITQRKRRAVIVAMCAKHSDFKIANFLNVARYFVHKVLMKLEASGGNFSTDSKSKNTFEIVKALQFTQKVQDLINADPRKSMKPSHTSFGHRS